MQKRIAVTIDSNVIQSGSSRTFSITNLEDLNRLLHEGWAIQEWQFITAAQGQEGAKALLVLNDESGLKNLQHDSPDWFERYRREELGEGLELDYDDVDFSDISIK